MSWLRRRLMMQQEFENPYDFNGVDKYLDTGIQLYTGQPFTLMIVFTSRAVDAGVNQTMFTTINHGSTHGAHVMQRTGATFNKMELSFPQQLGPQYRELFSDDITNQRKGFQLLRMSATTLFWMGVNVYTDASSYTSSSANAPVTPTTETLLLGANRLSSGIGEFWDGIIHNIYFEHRQLTTAERRNFFQQNGL